MKTKILTFSVFLFASLFTLCLNAQTYEKGEKVISGGLGLNTGTNLIGVFDYGMLDKISVGAGIWYQSISIPFFGSVNSSSLLLRGAYHLDEIIKVDKLDVYGGAELGIGISSGGGTNFGLLPGARYFFTDNLGAWAELPIYLSSGGGAYFRIGVSYKLN